MITTVENGRAVRIQGDPDHPVTQGFLCTKVNRYIERTYHHDRLTHPLRRVGPKGSGKFEAVSWDEALGEIAARLQQVIRDHGAESILPYSYAGTMGYLQGESMDRRFFHSLGASKLDRTICSTAGAAGMRMTVGANIGADTEAVGQSDLILLWGTNTLTAIRTCGRLCSRHAEWSAGHLYRPDTDAQRPDSVTRWIPIRAGDRRRAGG
jgi:anaerobic selenocysteine-containing dehydrogenase